MLELHTSPDSDLNFHVNVVTLQAQRERPSDMQCKDKFLLQSTVVSPNIDVNELPQDTVRIHVHYSVIIWT